VREMAAIFGRHRDFLRAVILISGVHSEVYRRDSAYSRELGDQFTAALQPLRHRIGPPGTDPDTALRACFTTVFRPSSSASPTGPASPPNQSTTPPTPPS
jgi:hypothetical protein